MSATATQGHSDTATSQGRKAGGSYRDLVAWQRAMEVAEAVYLLTSTLPESERFGLASQMRRAAVSVPSNIAEGHARQSPQDFIRFLRIARGSLAELGTQYEVAVRVRLLADDAQFTALIQEEAKILGGLIRALERKAGRP